MNNRHFVCASTTIVGLAPTHLPANWLAVVVTAISCAILPGCAVLSHCPYKCDPLPRSLKAEVFPVGSHRYDVYSTRKSGAALVLLHGLDGLTNCVLQEAARLSDLGWKVYLPALGSSYGECDYKAVTKRLKAKDSGWELNDPDYSGRVVEDLGTIADRISALHG
jgi:hypothetical protein